MLDLLAQTGFDRAKTPLGLIFVLAVTIFMLFFIFVGAAYMRSQENKARLMRSEAAREHQEAAARANAGNHTAE